MALTRVKFKEINGKFEVIEKETDIHNNNPIIYYGNEDHMLKDDDTKLIARGFTAFNKYFSKKTRTRTEDQKIAHSG